MTLLGEILNLKCVSIALIFKERNVVDGMIKLSMENITKVLCIISFS